MSLKELEAALRAYPSAATTRALRNKYIDMGVTILMENPQAVTKTNFVGQDESLLLWGKARMGLSLPIILSILYINVRFGRDSWQIESR